MMRRVLIITGLVAFAFTLLNIGSEGCALTPAQAPVDPDYPPPPPMAARDAGAG